MTEPRPWDITELAAGHNSTGNARPTLRPARTLRRVPTMAEQMNILFRQTDRDTRTIVRELARLGYDLSNDVPAASGDTADSRIYLTNVGRGRMVLVLTLVAVGDTVQILSVTFGRDTITSSAAAHWLQARAAR